MNNYVNMNYSATMAPPIATVAILSINKEDNSSNSSKDYIILGYPKLLNNLVIETYTEDGFTFVESKDLDIVESGLNIDDALNNLVAFMIEDYQNIKAMNIDKMDTSLKNLSEKYKRYLG